MCLPYNWTVKKNVIRHAKKSDGIFVSLGTLLLIVVFDLVMMKTFPFIRGFHQRAVVGRSWQRVLPRRSEPNRMQHVMLRVNCRPHFQFMKAYGFVNSEMSTIPKKRSLLWKFLFILKINYKILLINRIATQDKKHFYHCVVGYSMDLTWCKQLYQNIYIAFSKGKRCTGRFHIYHWYLYKLSWSVFLKNFCKNGSSNQLNSHCRQYPFITIGWKHLY